MANGFLELSRTDLPYDEYLERMTEPLESQAEQLAVIEANAERLTAIAYRGYLEFGEKGTVIILRQLENNSTILEDWQAKFKPMPLIPNLVSDWKEAGLQDMIIRYNPDVSVICTFLYPNGAHTSYHFAPEPPPPASQTDPTS